MHSSVTARWLSATLSGARPFWVVQVSLFGLRIRPGYATFERATVSTTAACSSFSETFRSPKLRPTSTPLWKLNPWLRNYRKSVSGKPGTVQIAARYCQG